MTHNEPRPGWSEEELLRLAFSLENLSEHPLAAAVVGAARERRLAPDEITAFTVFSGLGVRGVCNGKVVRLGSARFFAEQGLKLEPDVTERLATLAAGGVSAMLLAQEEQVVGLLGLADELRASAPAALVELRQMGIRLVLLSGDRRETVAAVTRNLDFDLIEAELLPADKTAVMALSSVSVVSNALRLKRLRLND